MASPRLRIGKQLEKSTTARSITVTDAANELGFLAPGANDSVLTIVAGVPTWQAISFPSEYDQYANVAAFPGTGAVDVIYYATAEGQFYIWTGAAYVAVPTAPNFTAAADSGTSQTINNGNTLSILGSRGFTTVASATDTITVTPPAGTTTGQVLTWNNTTSVWEAGASAGFTLAGSAGTNQTISAGDTITIQGTAAGFVTTGTATDTIVISVNEVKEYFAPAAAATTVTLSQTTVITSTLDVYRNGLIQELTTDYSVAAGVITFTDAFGASSGGTLQEVIAVRYKYS